MTPVLRSLLAAARAAEPKLVDRLRRLVEAESPSHNKAAVDRATALVAEWCRETGAQCILHPQGAVGDSLEARFGSPDPSRRPVLVLGHLDTVWEMGTLSNMPWREEGDRIAGPGVLDMKGGVVMALAALEILGLRDLPFCPTILLLHADEEIGSPASRALTEGIAAECSAVYVLEPGEGAAGAYKTARKGVGQFRLDVRGVGSHAGVDFGSGHSAVLELARQLERVAALSDPAAGVTVNPGVMGGGTRSNVVAAEAWAEIDVRLPSVGEADRVEQRLRSLQAVDPACTVSVTGAVNRPPMVRTPAIAGMFERAQRYAFEMGLEPLTEAATGGASDGNFTAALGVPTLDGMGAVGGGAHAAHEHLLRPFLAPRTALLAAMLL